MHISIIQRFDAPPPVWPPPRSPSEVADCLAYSRNRDPLGHAIHGMLACVYLFALPLSTAAETGAFLLLLGYTLLRLPNLWRSLMPFAASPVVLTGLLWAAWAILALTWTADLPAGLASLRSLRWLLLFSLLFPVFDWARPMLVSFLAGISVQGVLQLLQGAGLIPSQPERVIRFSGLASHPGHLGTAAGMAMMVALAFVVTARRKWALAAALTASALSAASATIAFGRGAVIGTLVALPTFAVLLWYRRERSAVSPFGARRATLAIAILCGGAVLAVLTNSPTAEHQLSTFFAWSDPSSPVGQRSLWWRTALDNFQSAPFKGIGTGATEESFRASPRLHAAASERPDLPRDHFLASHPHSMYLQTLSEQGIVGVLLLTGFLIALSRASLRAFRQSALTCAMTAALVVWFVAAAFEGLNLAGRTACLLGVAVTFTALPRVPRNENPLRDAPAGS